MVKNFKTEKAKELESFFKSCLTRNTFLRNQGYIDPGQFKVIRERILKDQAAILPAFDQCK